MIRSFVRLALAAAVSCACSRARGPAAPAPPEPEPSRELSIIAIGDTGRRTRALYENALAVNSLTAKLKPAVAVLFLGDNIYDFGFSGDTDAVRRRRFADVYRYFDPTFDALLPPSPATASSSEWRVHAVSGNHDYYTEYAADVLPFAIGYSDKGNQWAAHPDRKWKYHYRDVGTARWAIPASGRFVEVFFVDSAPALRFGPHDPKALTLVPPPAPTPADVRPQTRVDQQRAAEEERKREKEAEEAARRELFDVRWHLALKNELVRSMKDPSVAWRLIAAHHPLYTVGAHGGYTRWNETEGKTDHVPLCSREIAPKEWLKNQIDPEDECTNQWQDYRNKVQAAIRDAAIESGNPDARVHMMLAGHDHSLQLLWYPDREPVDCQACPRIHLVSGAGAKTSMVKNAPEAPRGFRAVELTAAGRRGESQHGFVRLGFTDERIAVEFHVGLRGATRPAPLHQIEPDPKERPCGYWINPRGELLDAKGEAPC